MFWFVQTLVLLLGGCVTVTQLMNVYDAYVTLPILYLRSGME